MDAKHNESTGCNCECEQLQFHNLTLLRASLRERDGAGKRVTGEFETP
jgi:hypothetical protein